MISPRRADRDSKRSLIALAAVALCHASCAHPKAGKAGAPEAFDYVYTQPVLGTVYTLSATSRGQGTYTQLQGTDAAGPIKPVKVDQSSELSCTETIIGQNANGPTAVEVWCPVANNTEGGVTTSWATASPVRVSRSGDTVLVLPADLDADLQLKYQRTFGQTIFVPSWAAMLAGTAIGGNHFALGKPVALELLSAGVFLGDTAAIVISSATAALKELTPTHAVLDFKAHATHPYDMDFGGTLTVDRATGWLVDAELRASVKANDPKTGFILDIVIDSKSTRTHTLPPAP